MSRELAGLGFDSPGPRMSGAGSSRRRASGTASRGASPAASSRKASSKKASRAATPASRRGRSPGPASAASDDDSGRDGGAGATNGRANGGGRAKGSSARGRSPALVRPSSRGPTMGYWHSEEVMAHLLLGAAIGLAAVVLISAASPVSPVPEWGLRLAAVLPTYLSLADLVVVEAVSLFALYLPCLAYRVWAREQDAVFRHLDVGDVTVFGEFPVPRRLPGMGIVMVGFGWAFSTASAASIYLLTSAGTVVNLAATVGLTLLGAALFSNLMFSGLREDRHPYTTFFFTEGLLAVLLIWTLALGVVLRVGGNWAPVFTAPAIARVVGAVWGA